LANDVLRNFFESPAFGLMEIRLMVTATVPKGVVRVSEATQIELVPEYQESPGRAGSLASPTTIWAVSRVSLTRCAR
jgi:hypothetical protein